MSFFTIDQIPSMGAVGIVVFTSKNSKGDTVTGTESQIDDYIMRVLKEPLTDWKPIDSSFKDVGAIPPAAVYKKAFDWGGLWTKAKDAYAQIKPALKPAAPSTPAGYMPPPKKNMTNMLIIGGIGVAVVVGLMVFMGGRGKKRRR